MRDYPPLSPGLESGRVGGVIFLSHLHSTVQPSRLTGQRDLLARHLV